MKFLTVATDASPHLDRLLRSAKYHGVPLEVLGAGLPYENHRTKIDLMLGYLAQLPPEEEVLFLDAYDTIFLCGPEEIEQKFRDSGADFLCSAEQNIKVADGFRERFRAWWRFPAYPKPYRFINSGTYVGRAGALLRVWKQQDLERLERLNCDQTLLNSHCVDHPDELSLDARQEIFAATAGRTGLEASDYRVENGRLRSVVTGSLPCVLHCPGKNYIGLEHLLAQLPFAGDTYQPTAADLGGRRKNTLLNWLTAKTTQDNFLFHLLLNAGLTVIGVGLLAFVVLKALGG